MSDFSRPHPSDTSKQLINLFVRVYECESTGEPSICVSNVALLIAKLNAADLCNEHVCLMMQIFNF